MTPTIKSARRAEGEKATWTNPDNGQVFYRWDVTVQNGEQEVSTDILRKPDSPDPTDLPVEQKNGRWKVAQQQAPGKSGGKSYEADSRGLRGKNASMAVAYAKDLVIADKIELGQLSLYAGRFYDFIEAKAKVDA